MAMRKSAPKELGVQARRLWRDLTKEFEFGPHEFRLLEEICREVDLIEKMNERLAGADFYVTGSQGQQVANPLLREIREHRAILARLIAALRLPVDENSTQAATRSTSARELANARWHG